MFRWVLTAYVLCFGSYWFHQCFFPRDREALQTGPITCSFQRHPGLNRSKVCPHIYEKKEHLNRQCRNPTHFSQILDSVSSLMNPPAPFPAHLAEALTLQEGRKGGRGLDVDLEQLDQQRT